MISCTENLKICIEVLDELELLIDKKVIFDENKFSGGLKILHGQLFQRDLDCLGEWCRSYKFDLNTGKCKSAHCIRVFDGARKG
jgi:hypothetical protein